MERKHVLLKAIVMAVLAYAGAPAHIISGQATVIVTEGFEAAPAGGPVFFNNTLTGGTGEFSSAYANSGSYGFGYYSTEGAQTAILESPDINTTGYMNIQFAVRAMGSWVDNDEYDFIKVFVSPDGGTTYYCRLWLAGGGNEIAWTYATGSAMASAVYAAENISAASHVVSGSNLYSTLTITGLPESSNLRIKILIGDQTGGTERWGIDDIIMTGELTSPIITGLINGSPFCVTSSASAAVTVPYTSIGVFGELNTYTAQLSDLSGSFANPTDIGTEQSNSNAGSISAFIPAGTASGAGYRIRVVSSDPVITGAPGHTIDIINGVSNVTTPFATARMSAVELIWSNPLHCYDEIMIVAREGSAVSLKPTGDGSSYMADLEYGSGSTYDGGFVVFKGIISSQVVNGLSNGISYYFTFFTRHGSNWSEGITVNATPVSYPPGARWAVASGDWYSLSTWSDSPGGSAGASVPEENGDVYIEGEYNISNVPQITLNSLVISENCSIIGSSAENIISLSSYFHVANGKTLTLGGQGGSRVSLTLNSTVNAVIYGTVTWYSGGLRVYSFTNNGTITFGPEGMIRRNILNTDDRTEFILGPGATIVIGSAYGIVLGPENYNGNIQTYTRTFSPEANYIYASQGFQVTGDALPETVASVTLSGIATDLTISNQTLAITGTLSLGPGTTFHVGPSQSVTAGALISSGTMAFSSPDLDENASFIVTGSIQQNPGSVVTYTRHLNPTGYHYISSPLSLSAMPESVYAYNEESGGWESTTGFVKGKGYAITGMNSLYFSGELVAGDVEIPVTSPYLYPFDGTVYAGREHVNGRDPDLVGGNYGGGGWNLLGNPYTSAINVYDFIDANFSTTPSESKFDPNYVALYLYNGESYVFVTGDDETGWGDPNDYNDGIGQLESTHLQAGQGFFVLAMNDGVEFIFTRDMQEHRPGTIMLKSARTSGRWPGLSLKVTADGSEKSTLVVFNDGMTTGLDPIYDVGQMGSGGAVNIYTALVESNGVNFSRQALPENGAVKNVIPVGLDYVKGGNVTFSAEVEPFRNFKFWLEDRETGIVTDLGSNSYSVNIPSKTGGTGRFFIHVAASRSNLRDHKNVINQMNLTIWSSQSKILHIEGDVSEKSICQIYDMQGLKVWETQLSGGCYNSFILSSLKTGVYLVTVTEGFQTYTRRVVLL